MSFGFSAHHVGERRGNCSRYLSCGEQGKSGSGKLQQRQTATSDSPCTDTVAALLPELIHGFSQNLLELENGVKYENLLLLSDYS